MFKTFTISLNQISQTTRLKYKYYSAEDDTRSVYSNGSGSGIFKQNSWVGSGSKLNVNMSRSVSNNEVCLLSSVLS